MVPSDLENWLADPGRRPLVMGILNVTPDSFSDGGRYSDPRAAADHAAEMAGSGADIIDIGGESTRPGSQPVGAEEQIRRLIPALIAIRKQTPIAISVDTTQAVVARAALGAGADWINDISAGRDDPEMLPAAAGAGVPIILMHMQGRPATMQEKPIYSIVTTEVCAFLESRMGVAREAGVAVHRILLDPGIGFGKAMDHSLSLLHDLPLLAALGRPLVIGASRKSFIGKILAEADPLKRGAGDAAVISWAVANRASILRVHDVAAAAAVLRVTGALMRGAR